MGRLPVGQQMLLAVAIGTVIGATAGLGLAMLLHMAGAI